MTTYEHGLKTVTDLIGLHILSFIEQAQERFDKPPCEALNDITITVIDEIKTQRKRLEAEIQKRQEQADRAAAKIRDEDSLRHRVLQEIAG